MEENEKKIEEVKEDKDRNNEIELEIIQVLDKIRPFIERDGGDIKLEKYENGVVYVRFFGACVGCASVDYTLQDGVAAILKEEIPEVESVVNVNAAFFEEGLTEDNIEEN